MPRGEAGVLFSKHDMLLSIEGNDVSDLPASLRCQTSDVHSVDGATRTRNVSIGGTKVIFSSRATSKLDSQSLAFEFGTVESCSLSVLG